MTPADLEEHRLKLPNGEQAVASDLPLLVAWRSEKPAEGHFLLPRTDKSVWEVAWTATPFRDPQGQLLGIFGSVTCGPGQADMRRMAELAHDLRTPLQSLRL